MAKIGQIARTLNATGISAIGMACLLFFDFITLETAVLGGLTVLCFVASDLNDLIRCNDRNAAALYKIRSGGASIDTTD